MRRFVAAGLWCALAVFGATLAKLSGLARFDVLAGMLAGVPIVAGAAYLMRQRRQMREYQSRWSAIVETTQDTVIGETVDGIVTSSNHGAQEALGMQIESGTILQRAILAHASYSIIATDKDGIIELFNPAAERTLGYAAAEMLGKQTPEILHDSAEMAVSAAALSQELATAIRPGGLRRGSKPPCVPWASCI